MLGNLRRGAPMLSKSQALLAGQRSHLLVVLSRPRVGHESEFREWYRNACTYIKDDFVLTYRGYEQHPTDITQGRWPRLPFKYLSLYEISVDGADAASGLIDKIINLHQEESSAEPPATWLYYPSCEKVGRQSATDRTLLTVAFANGLPGQEAAFREWYCTRHIRHAVSLSALVSGQCFERTQFQRPGATEARFSTIAIYEQEGSVDSLVEELKRVPPGAFHFPMLDLEGSRFSESVYTPI